MASLVREPAPFIKIWTDDPLNNTLVSSKVPDLNHEGWPIAIREPQAAPNLGPHPHSSPDFRYWVACEALARARDFWASVQPHVSGWQNGGTLFAEIDYDNDLNAYYNREGLQFGAYKVPGNTVYLAESADVVAHEVGHAILDAVRPDLWDAKFVEVDAFHEAFADITAVFVALDLKENRTEIIESTGGRLNHTSRVSRIAESVGISLRKRRADSADVDCLRNLANSFYYIDPTEIPPAGPAYVLTSQGHSFSRVFSSALLDCLAAMAKQDIEDDELPDDRALRAVSRDLARLLLDSARASPPEPRYFAKIARKMLVLDASKFDRRYARSLRQAFVRRGILSLSEIVEQAQGAEPGRVPRTRSGRTLAGFDTGPVRKTQVAIAGAKFGLGNGVFEVEVPAVFSLSSERSAERKLRRQYLPAEGVQAEIEHFLDNLFSRGRVDVRGLGNKAVSARHPFARPTHEVVEFDGGLRLRRLCFDFVAYA